MSADASGEETYTEDKIAENLAAYHAEQEKEYVKRLRQDPKKYLEEEGRMYAAQELAEDLTPRDEFVNPPTGGDFGHASMYLAMHRDEYDDFWEAKRAWDSLSDEEKIEAGIEWMTGKIQQKLEQDDAVVAVQDGGQVRYALRDWGEHVEQKLEQYHAEQDDAEVDRMRRRPAEYLQKNDGAFTAREIAEDLTARGGIVDPGRGGHFGHAATYLREHREEFQDFWQAKRAWDDLNEEEKVEEGIRWNTKAIQRRLEQDDAVIAEETETGETVYRLRDAERNEETD